jgi:ribosomal protein L40E
MPDELICSDCGARLSPDAHGGLCVRCLFTLGLNTEAGTEAAAPVVPITEKPGDDAAPGTLPTNTAAHVGEPADPSTPESLFDRRWAQTLLKQVMERLRAEYASRGEGELFAALQGHLSGAERLVPYAELGVSLGMSEGVVKKAVHDLRKRYGKLLRAEIAATVSGPEAEEGEIRHLIAVASRRPSQPPP